MLAAAGLHRLGHDGRITEHLYEEVMLPAAGQGALAIEIRANDAATAEIVQQLNHEATSLACKAERAFLKGLGGGCLVPIAAHARIKAETLNLSGLVASPDGTQMVRGAKSGPSLNAASLGLELADELLSRGADKILRQTV